MLPVVFVVVWKYSLVKIKDQQSASFLAVTITLCFVPIIDDQKGIALFKKRHVKTHVIASEEGFVRGDVAKQSYD
jgi:hypothetical protein